MENQFDNLTSGPVRRSNPDHHAVKVRCPDCFKLYSVNTAEIREPRPRFECVDCHTKFWIAYPEATEAKGGVIGFPLEWVEPTSQLAVEAFACPKCGTGYAAGDQECKKCGVVFLKIDQLQDSKDMPSADKAVREHWEIVLADYDKFENHQAFINTAFADDSLEYAMYQYTTILNVVPNDEMAKKAKVEIAALQTARIESSVKAPEVAEEKSAQSPFRFLNFIVGGFRKIKFTNLIMVMCGFVIAAGLMIPHLRNLVGFGTSILFFIIALRYYFRVI